jgi:hypothetical protein
MKKRLNQWLCTMLVLAAGCFSCSDDSDKGFVNTRTGQSLYVVARQSADAPIQYQAEMPLFTLDNIKSFNPETGELRLENVVFDTHLFQDIACQYRVYFYDGNDLLFDARAVSWFSSAGYFSDLTFQSMGFNINDAYDSTERLFFIRYGYPGTIVGDETVKELMNKNAPGMERFISILRQAGKIVYF